MGEPQLVGAGARAFAIFPSQGNGAYLARQDVASGQGSTAVAPADLNGEARPDAVAVNEAVAAAPAASPGPF